MDLMGIELILLIAALVDPASKARVSLTLRPKLDAILTARLAAIALRYPGSRVTLVVRLAKPVTVLEDRTWRVSLLLLGVGHRNTFPRGNSEL